MPSKKPQASDENGRSQQARFARMLVHSATVAPFFRDLLRASRIPEGRDRSLAA